MQPAKFRQARQHIGLSAIRLGELIDVNERNVRRWELADYPLPRMAEIIVIMLVMSAEVRKFLGMTKAELERATSKGKFDFNSPAPPIVGRKRKRAKR